MSSLAGVPFYTHKILECMVPAEYASLTDGNKEIIRMILSCGSVDMHVGNIIREKLNTIFSIGTTTRTNLDAILAETPPGP